MLFYKILSLDLFLDKKDQKTHEITRFDILNLIISVRRKYILASLFI